ncbi:hypothetical protein GCM10022238_26900 [Gordonia hankookensis]
MELNRFHGVLPVTELSGPLPIRQLFRNTCTWVRIRDAAKAIASSSRALSRPADAGEAVFGADAPAGSAHRTGWTGAARAADTGATTNTAIRHATTVANDVAERTDN